MIKKRLQFQLMNANLVDWNLWKSMEKQINMIALNHNVIRSNRLDDDEKHTTSVDITCQTEEDLINTMIRCSEAYERELSGIQINLISVSVLESSEVSFVIGAMKEQLNEMKMKSKNGVKK